MRTQSTKLHRGTIEKIEEYQEEEGIETKSEALRQLIHDGLEAQDTDPTVRFEAYLMILGALLLGTALSPTNDYIAVTGLVLFILPIALLYLPDDYRPEL